MSLQITTAFVEQYSANVMHLAQQKGSRLRSAVTVETVKGKNAFFEQIGSVAARKRTSRHSDTPRMDTPHARRRVSLVDYDWADLIDDLDKVRMLIDPSSEYAMAAANAMGRAMDDQIVEAFFGTAYTGETGSTSTVFDTNMVVGVDVVDSAASAGDVGLNITKLIKAKQLLDANEVDPDDQRFIAANATQLSSLLKQTKVQSADYNSVKALVSGEIDTFMGFKFLHSERLGVDANSDHRVPFWAKSGVKLAIGAEPKSRITERADKNYATQVFYTMAIGATRMEEARCGYIACDPAGSPGSYSSQTVIA